MATMAQIGAKLFLDVADYNKGIQSADKNTKGFQKTLANLNNAIGTVLVAGIGAATVAMAAFAKSTVQTGMAFEQSLATVAAVKGFRNISDATSEGGQALAEFEKKARELGKSTAYSATQATDAMVELARAGLSTTDVVGAIGPALFLAGSSASSMTSATTLLAATMKQFDLNADSAARITDVFTIAQQKSLFAMDSLAEAMKYGGTIGSAFGMSLEETTAALAQFRDLGVEGSMAGTQFRQAMISLANPTAKAQATLKRYGLTVDDVSPATKSFTEILETLGKANVDLSGITDLVSKRASGSFTKLIQKFQEGTSTYNELIEAFETGGGAAEDTYNTMIDNVAGRFSILKSAFEELQLTFYDTFSEPMKEALGTSDDSGLIGLVNTLTNAFQASGDIFRSVFQDIFGTTLQSINSNSIEIASAIGGIAVQAAYLGKTLIDWIPTLATIAKYFVIIFATGKVIAMAQAVATFGTALYGAVAAAGSLRAAMAAAVAASGGWIAVIAGIATLTTLMATFAAGSSKAAKAQEQLARSLQASADASREFNTNMAQGARSGITGDKGETIEQLKTELATREELSNVIESQLDKLAQLSAQEENNKISKGELFQIEIDGKKILVDQATALRLATTALGEQANVLDQVYEKQDALNRQEEQAKAAFQSNISVIEDAKQALKDYNDGLLNEYEFMGLVMGAQQEFDGTLTTAVKGATSAANAVEELTTQILASQTAYTLASKAADGFANSLSQAEAASVTAAAKAQKEQEKEEQANRKRRSNQYAKDAKKASDARLKLEEQLQRSLAKLRAEESEQLAIDLAQRLDDARKVYDEDLKYATRNAKKRAEIERSYQETVKGLLDETIYARVKANQDAANEIMQANIRYGDTERQRLDTELADKLKAEDDNLEAINNAIFQASVERGEALNNALEKRSISEEEFTQRMALVYADQLQQEEQALQATNAKKNAIEQQFGIKRTELNKSIAKTIADEQLGLAQQGILQQLEQQQQADLEFLRAKGLTEQQLAQIEEIYRQQRVNAEQELVDQFVKPYGDYTKRIDELNKKSTNALTKRGKDRADKEIEYLQKKFELEQKLESTRIATAGNEEIQAQAIARVREELELLDQQYEKVGGGIRSMAEKAVGAFSKIASGIGKTFTAIVGFAKNAGQAIGQGLESGLSFFTGGAATMNIGGILQQAATASIEAQKAGKERQDALKEQLKAGDITQEEYDQAIGGGLGAVDPAEQAKEFIDELLSSATGFAMAIAEQAPLIIDGLASALPILIDALVVAIPIVIRALGDGLPTVVFALVDGIIALLPVLADALLNDALPKVIDGIIYLLTVKLPELAATLTPIVADLVQFIIEQAPRIVNAITSALPTVIDFLVTGITQILTGIPTLIETLLAAIPVIITELLGGISDLVMVVFQAIPMIIEKVIMALPDIISALLRGLLGVLVELASALPMLIAEIINLLPVLVTAIVQLIPEIIIALVEALPLIIENLILALPLIITALINLIPQLIVEIIKALPRLIAVLVIGIIDLLVIQLPRLVMVLAQSLADAIISSIMAVVETFQGLVNTFPQMLNDALALFEELPQRIRDGLSDGLDRMVGFFRDVIEEITSLGRAETASFGDTPGAIRAGSSGLTANFAPDDYIIAAQKPMDLLQQAMGAVGSQLPKSLTSMFAKSFPPPMTQGSSPQGSTSSTTNITIQAEGRVLDDIQVKALDRGHAPKMERKLKKNQGAKVGFDRGRFNRFGK